MLSPWKFSLILNTHTYGALLTACGRGGKSNALLSQVSGTLDDLKWSVNELAWKITVARAENKVLAENRVTKKKLHRSNCLELLFVLILLAFGTSSLWVKFQQRRQQAKIYLKTCQKPVAKWAQRLCMCISVCAWVRKKCLNYSIARKQSL